MGNQGQCKLAKDGEKARDVLLRLLYPNSYTASQLGRDTGLDRGATLSKILGAKGNLQLRTLEQFFEQLLRRLEEQVDRGQLNQTQVSQELQRCRLTESYRSLKESERSFYLPRSLYDSAELSNKPRQEPKKPKVTILATCSEDTITHLLWNLDYKRQERDFTDALEQQSQCAAFSIAAPCDTTQRWILNRLMRAIPNRDGALLLPAIRLKGHDMRHQFDYFWEELSHSFGTKPVRSEVLKEMCHANIDKPIILTIYEFRQFEKAQRQLLEEFWEPLTQGIIGSKRSLRSRIVLFLVDQSCFSQGTTNLVKLEPLSRIPQQDVKTWLESDLVTQYWQSKLGSRSKESLTEQLNQDPYAVLDTICYEFGVEGGIVEIEQAWRWWAS